MGSDRFPQLLAAIYETSIANKLPTVYPGVGSSVKQLFDYSDFDELVACFGSKFPFVVLNNARTGLFPWHYESVLSALTSGTCAQTVLSELLENRSTIIFQHLHRRSSTCWSIAKSIEEILRPMAVHCNAYITPQNSSGVSPHADQHDTYLIQLGGRKRWKVWQSVDRDPLSPNIVNRQSDYEKLDETNSILNVELLAGDVLAIPRGFVHGNETADAPSSHLTIGIIDPTVRTWLESSIRGRNQVSVRSEVSEERWGKQSVFPLRTRQRVL